MLKSRRRVEYLMYKIVTQYLNQLSFVIVRRNMRWKSLLLVQFPKRFFNTCTGSKMKYLNQQEATDIDIKLFNEYKFSVDQLMELAGLACSHAVVKEFPVDRLKNNKVLVCCGPGNNGGDGLVCARHLSLMGYQPSIYYPRRTAAPLYENLTKQCQLMGLSFVDGVESVEELNGFSVIVDALFGFSFRPPIREPFVKMMKELSLTHTPIASVDIPSGWHVEEGPIDAKNDIQPELLISLTAPKLCARSFKGKHHYLGGRFVPPSLQAEYDLNLPEYPSYETVVKIN